MQTTSLHWIKNPLGLWLLFACHLTGLARTEYASPTEVYIVAYPREVSCTFLPGNSYDHIYQKPDSNTHYIAFPGARDYIVRLDDPNVAKNRRTKKPDYSGKKRYANTSAMDYLHGRGGQFLPDKDYTVESKRAYLVFLPERQYVIRDVSEETYKLEYPVGETLMAVSIPKDRFLRHDGMLSGYELTTSYEDMKPEDAMCVLKDVDGQRIGFGCLVRDKGSLYCLTLQSFALAGEQIRIFTHNGSKLEVTGLDLDSDRNLARFRIHGQRFAFEGLHKPPMGEKLLISETTFSENHRNTEESSVIGFNESGSEVELTKINYPEGGPIFDKDRALVGLTLRREPGPRGYNHMSKEDLGVWPKDFAVPLDSNLIWHPLSQVQPEIIRIAQAEAVLRQFYDTLEIKSYYSHSKRRIVHESKELTLPMFKEWIAFLNTSAFRLTQLKGDKSRNLNSHTSMDEYKARGWNLLSNRLRSEIDKLERPATNSQTEYLSARRRLAETRLKELVELTSEFGAGKKPGSKDSTRIREISSEFSRAPLKLFRL